MMRHPGPLATDQPHAKVGEYLFFGDVVQAVYAALLGHPRRHSAAGHGLTCNRLNLSTTPRLMLLVCHCCSSTASSAACSTNWCRYCALSSRELDSPAREH